MRVLVPLASFLIAWSPSLARASQLLSVTRSEGAIDCPDAKQLARETDARIGHDILAASDDEHAAADFLVSFERTDAGYRALVRSAADASTARTLDDASSDCAGLASAVVVTLTLLTADRDTTSAHRLRRREPKCRRPKASFRHVRTRFWSSEAARRRFLGPSRLRRFSERATSSRNASAWASVRSTC